jgi:hypothetical protein
VSQSRQTLVSAAEKNGMKLVCVIFTEETPYQFEDTITLFQYGFENFKCLSIDENETNYKIDTSDLFDTESDLFGDSTPLISMESDKYIVLPNSADFDDAISTLEYNNDDTDSDILATIDYTYNDVNVGTCNILYTKSETPSFDFDTDESLVSDNGEMSNDVVKTETVPEDATIIFINVKILIIIILGAAAAIMFVLFIISIIKSYNFSPRGQSHRRRREHKKEIRSAKREASQKSRRAKKQARRDARIRRKKYK